MELKGNEELVAAFRNGDRQVLGQIYEAYVDEVEAMLRGGFTFTSDGKTVRFQGFREPFRVRETVQDSFIHAFRERVRKGYDSSRSFGPYLKTVIRNHMIDRFRRRQLEGDLFVAAEAVAEEDEPGEQALDRLGSEGGDDPSPEIEALRGELADLLDQFIDQLDEEDRAIIKHHMLGPKTQNEMADHLDSNRNRVRKRIRIIRTELLGHLKRGGFVGRSDIGDVLRNVAKLGLIGAIS